MEGECQWSLIESDPEIFTELIDRMGVENIIVQVMQFYCIKLLFE